MADLLLMQKAQAGPVRENNGAPAVVCGFGPLVVYMCFVVFVVVVFSCGVCGVCGSEVFGGFWRFVYSLPIEWTGPKN